MIFARDPQIVRGAERLFAQISKRKPRHAHGGKRHVHGSPLERQLLRLAFASASQSLPGLIERSVGRSVGRHVPYRHAAEFLETKIGARRKPNHLSIVFEHPDEGQKQRAVQAVLVKLRGLDVRGRHQHYAARKQLREQPAEDHGVGDVGHMKLVEAKQPGFLRKIRRDQLDRIGAGIFAELHLLAKRVDAFVHVEHEFVKMRAALPQHRARVEEQIHQHGFAATDVAVDVKALDSRRALVAAAEHPSERRRFSRQAMFGNLGFELGKLIDDGKLRGVTLNQVVRRAGGVSRFD